MEDTNNVKEEGVAGRSLIDLVFSWSIEDVLNKELYKNQVEKIPDTFLTVTSYMKSFIPSLIEETHADLLSTMMSLSHAPFCEILAVETSKDHRLPKDLFYEIQCKRKRESENSIGMYEPKNGDLIALTDVRPKCIDDLNRPRNFYLIAYVVGSKDDSSDKLPILASKPINGSGGDTQIKSKRDTLFAVYLMNMTTNDRFT